MSPRQRLVNVGLAVVYAVVYRECYVHFLNANYASAGYDLYPRPEILIGASFVITVVPVLCFRGVRAVSSVVAVMVYLLLYVPVIITFALGSPQPLDRIVAIQLTFLVGMVLIFLADLIIIENPLRLTMAHDLMPVALGLAIVSMAYMLVIYHGHLHFPSFGEDLYEARAENERLGTGLLTRYLSSWLATVLVPLCLAYGLTRRRLHYTLAGTAACLVLYVASANKLSILLPFFIAGFYFLAHGHVRQLYTRLTVSLAALIGVLSVTAILGTVAFVVSAVVLMRTIGNGGQLTSAYYDYFRAHVQTGYSHVNGLSLFTRPYPYGTLGIGQVVGEYYWSPFMNANANFWATDGIAALGLAGVLIISVVLTAWLMVMNSVTRDYDLLFVILLFLPFVTTVLNQSLFSAIWSGGGFLLLLFLALSGTDRSRARVPAIAVGRAAASPTPSPVNPL